MNEQTIFTAALEREPGERSLFLDEVCGADQELRQRVEKLLRLHADAGSFLDSPVADSSPTLNQAGSEKPGTQIGPYKLLQQIGEGGMGVVWMAEQTQPVQRKVALKVIKPGMDSRQVIARFEAERQALAMMDHVNIARVLDAGTTGSGLPYFVMELVHGVPITKYCDDNHLTPRERLELFVPVCQAIQHAHQKGIIHRDIKPSNVMITLYDGKPVPKVIDFGVAKATEQTLTERTLFTQFGTMVGTLEYMSPEQAEMSALGVDTRSDIFSLGVLLYELLTGSTPLTHKRMKEAAYAQILRLIKEEEPPRPSTRLADSGEALASISAQRQMEPAKLTKLVRGELDWIVMKTLEKDRNRRYETANAFAADVQRYLADEPVEACPPSRTYRVKKFVRRNKKAVLATAAMLLVLVGGVVGTTFGLIRAEHAREREAVQRRQAQEAAAIAQAVNDFLQRDLLGQADVTNQADDGNGRDPNVTVRTLLDRSARAIEGRFAAQPLTEAAIHQTVGTVYSALGRYDEARHHLERSVELRTAQLGPNHLDTLSSKDDLAVVLKRQGKRTEARKLLNEIIATRTALQGPNDLGTLKSKASLAFMYGAKLEKEVALWQEIIAGQTAQLGPEHRDTLSSRQGLALAYQLNKMYDQAEPLWRDLIAAETHRLGANHPQTLTSMHDLAVLYMNQEKLDQAELVSKEVLAGRTATLEPGHPDVLSSKFALAGIYEKQKRLDEAEALYREVLAGRLAKLGPNHPNSQSCKESLINLYIARNKYDQAEQLLQEFIAVTAAQADATSPAALADKYSLATIYARHGKDRQAEPLYREVLAGRLATSGPDDSNGVKDGLAAVYASLGLTLRDLNRAGEALEPLRKATELWKQLRQADPHREWYSHEEAYFSSVLADLLELIGRSQDALEYAQASVRLHQELALSHPDSNEYPDRLAGSQDILVKVLLSLGEAASDEDDLGDRLKRYKEAEQSYRQSLANWEKVFSLPKASTAHRAAYLQTARKLAQLLDGMGQAEEGEKVIRDARVVMERMLAESPSDPNVWEHQVNLGRAYADDALWDEAVAEYTKAVELKPDAWQPWSGRAFAYFHRQQWDKAVSDFSKAIELAPQVHTNWWHRGHSYLALEQWDKAAADFGQVVEKWPDGSEGWYLRAVAFAQLNQLDKALADLHQAIAKGFNNVEQMKTDPKLDPLRNREDFGKLLEEFERQGKSKK